MKKLIPIIFLFSGILYGQEPIASIDSLQPKYNPKFQIYGRYFNPFAIGGGNFPTYRFEFAFKWQYRYNWYFGVDLNLDKFGIASEKQILAFQGAYRFTWKKLDWIHLELATGPALSHRKGRSGNAISDDWGIGIHHRSEIQFDIGTIGNISIGNYQTLVGVYEYRVDHLLDGSKSVMKVITSERYVSQSPIAYIGFNLYIK